MHQQALKIKNGFQYTEYKIAVYTQAKSWYILLLPHTFCGKKARL
jgi:hypothetical protein